MAAIINADDGAISGASGLKLSSDTSGALNIQTNGVTAIAISASQAVSFPATTSLNFTSANITTLTSSSATITNLIATTASISDLSATVTRSASGTITNLLATTATVSASTYLATASGSVGIGTTNVVFAKLNVVGTGNANSIMTETAAFLGTSANGLFIGSDSADTMMGVNNSGTRLTLLSRSGGVYSKAFTIDSASNIGISTTPSAWGGDYKAVQFPAGTVSAYQTGVLDIFQNLRDESAGTFKYVNNGSGTRYAQTGGTHRWYYASSGTAGAAATLNETMRIDDGGNLLIGVTANANISGGTVELTGGSSGDNNNSGFSISFVHNSTTLNAYISGQKSEFDIATFGSTPMLFLTNNTERARITSDGKFFIGTTTTVASGTEIAGIVGSGRGLSVRSEGGATSFAGSFWNNAASGDNLIIQFYVNAAGDAVGSIDYNRSGGAIRYNTTSDYRAKDVYDHIQNAGETIDALKVYRGKMKGATIERPMMIAHEAQQVVPYAVGGEKDAVNEDGTPKYQTMDHQILVPLLIAEIQSLRQRVAQLEVK